MTGCYRSGTTLIANFLNTHSQIRCYNQAFTDYFIERKKQYYFDRIISSKKYLGMGSPPLYFKDDFDNYCLSTKLQNLDFGIGEGCMGEPELRQWGVGEEYRIMLSRHSLGRPSTEVLGNKEILCHEFATALLRSEVKMIFILRDPKRMLESLNYGRGHKYTGGHRPTLINLRNWREIAETAIELKSDPNVFVTRYEDFVNTVDERSRLFDFLGVKMEVISLQNLFDQDGKPWSSNTSFVSQGRRQLDLSLALYTEAVCYFELRKLGYSTVVDPEEIPKIMSGFREPVDVFERNYYELDYSTSKENVVYEIERWKKYRKLQSL